MSESTMYEDRVICMALEDHQMRVLVHDAREEMAQFATMSNVALEEGYTISTNYNQWCDACDEEIARILTIWDPKERKRVGTLHIYPRFELVATIGFERLMHKVYNVLPMAQFGQDNDGQLIINTGLKLEEDGLTLSLMPEDF